jgi:LysM repeat protein
MARDNRARNQKDIVRLGSNKWRNRLERQGRLDKWDKAFKADPKAAMQALRGKFKNNPYAFAGALAGGYEPATDGYVPQPAQNYTVTKTDNLQTIADQNKTDVDSLLAANSDVNSIKPGMVLNIPRRRDGLLSPTRDGLPSNAELGKAAGEATPFMEAPDNYRVGEKANPVFAPGRTGFLGSSGVNVQNAQPLPGQGTAWASRPVPEAVQVANWNAAAAIKNEFKFVTTPTTPYRTNTVTPYARQLYQSGALNKPAGTTIKPTLADLPANQYGNFITERNQYFKVTNNNLRAKIDLLGQTPTPAELKYLIETGQVKAGTVQGTASGTAPDYTVAPGSGRWQGHGGRRRGRWQSYPSKQYVQQQQPSQSNPFASNAGFGGLVSWRI